MGMVARSRVGWMAWQAASLDFSGCQCDCRCIFSNPRLLTPPLGAFLRVCMRGGTGTGWPGGPSGLSGTLSLPAHAPPFPFCCVSSHFTCIAVCTCECLLVCWRLLLRGPAEVEGFPCVCARACVCASNACVCASNACASNACACFSHCLHAFGTPSCRVCPCVRL